jgi:hypothetical protein
MRRQYADRYPYYQDQHVYYPGQHANQKANGMPAVSDELRDVTRIMMTNVDNLVHRGEALNCELIYDIYNLLYIALETRASDLSQMSGKYKEHAKQLNRKSFMFKVLACLGALAFLFLFLRFFLF